MATARERAVQRVYEQIPHPGVQYAYLALEAGNVDEFESLKAEAMKSPALAHYRSALSGQAAVGAEEAVGEKKATVSKAAAAAKARTKKAPAEVPTPAAEDAGTGPADAAEESDATTADAPETSEDSAEETPKEKARRIARERLMSRQKGA